MQIELVNMIIECCSQERSYSTFFGLVGERFSKLNRVWTDCFEEAFKNYYETIHRYETNRMRNIARFMGHLLASDSLSWVVLQCVRLTEEDTTASSRIFLKILLNEVMESMGLKQLAERFKDPEIRKACEGLFPMDSPKNTRFATNYFTSIGLGILTEEMREYLKVGPHLIVFQRYNLQTIRRMLLASSWNSDEQCLKLNHRPPIRQIPTQRRLIPTLAVVLIPAMMPRLVHLVTRPTIGGDGGVPVKTNVTEHHQLRRRAVHAVGAAGLCLCRHHRCDMDGTICHTQSPEAL